MRCGLLLALAASAWAGELEAPVRVEAAGAPVDVYTGHAAPCVADLEGDGVRDLLVGQFWPEAGKGHLRFHRNEGADAAPRLAAFRYVPGPTVPAG
jgi:hypothetical protein